MMGFDDDEYDDFNDDDDCFECDGVGFVMGDCGEDCCPCADPEMQHPWYPCEICTPVKTSRP